VQIGIACTASSIFTVKNNVDRRLWQPM